MARVSLNNRKNLKATDVLIIGAGISGLLCATKLREAGISVRLLDKGRGVGGRMATRLMDGARLDHGAQYFTVRDSQLQEFVNTWLDANVVKEWFRHLPEDSNPEGYPRYCGIRGMTDVPKYLAKDLDVYLCAEVTQLIRKAGSWMVQTISGNSYIARDLVITAPLPQALKLLDTMSPEYVIGYIGALREVSYERGLSTLAILDGPSGLPAPGGLKVHEAPLTWIADNQIKGISPKVSAITIHANATFAEEYWHSHNGLRGNLMIEAALPFIKANIIEFDCHRWGFTTPINPWPEEYFHNAELHLTLAGDSFGGARIEGAALSGFAAASKVLDSLSIC